MPCIQASIYITRASSLQKWSADFVFIICDQYPPISHSSIYFVYDKFLLTYLFKQDVKISGWNQCKEITMFFLTIVKIFLDQIDIEIETSFTVFIFIYSDTLCPLTEWKLCCHNYRVGAPYIGIKLKTFVSYLIPCLISLIYLACLVVPISFLYKLIYCISKWSWVCS